MKKEAKTSPASNLSNALQTYREFKESDIEKKQEMPKDFKGTQEEWDNLVDFVDKIYNLTKNVKEREK